MFPKAAMLFLRYGIGLPPFASALHTRFERMGNLYSTRDVSMAANIYILSACDAWAEHSSMRILGVTTDENMLYSMLAAKNKAGDMEYDGSG